MRVSLKAVIMGLGTVVLAAGIVSSLAAVKVYADRPEMTTYYNGFLYGLGWSPDIEDNNRCEAPAGSYVTSMKVSLTNQPEHMTGTIAYQVNVSGLGWQDWVENGMEAGEAQGELPLEAIRVKLTGDLAGAYDVYYRVLQSGVWTQWSKNEETAGVEDQGLRIDGIRMSIVKKGGEVPQEPKELVPTRPMIALTFDDGPRASVTERILNSLEENGGRATFFMVGNRVPGAAATVKRMVAGGNEVGNHTYDHKYLTDMSDAEIRSNLGRASQTIVNAGGVFPTLMRPTGGYYHTASLSTLRSMGMSAVMWSIDTLDWKHRSAKKTIDTVLSQVKDGDIILMHDIYHTTADAAEILIPELTARGYQLVTVSELANARGGMKPGVVYSGFGP